MNVIDRMPVTTALISLLTNMAGAFQVGNHSVPDGATFPFIIVWSIAGGGMSGPPLGASHSDASFVYQVDSVSDTPQGAEMLAARVRDTVIGRSAAGGYSAAIQQPVGVVVHDRIGDGGAAGIIVEGDRPNEVYTVPERFLLSATPA